MITEKMKALTPDVSGAVGALRSRPITPRQHAMLDYSNSALVGAAPQLFGLSGATARLAAAYASIETAVNLLSDTPLGVKRVIPFRTHRAIDKWTGLAFLAAALAPTECAIAATSGSSSARQFSARPSTIRPTGKPIPIGDAAVARHARLVACAVASRATRRVATPSAR